MKLSILSVLLLPVLATSNGVQISREIKSISPEDSLLLKFDSGCSSVDEYGSNNCKFAWGSDVSGNFDVELGVELEKGSVIKVDLKIDRFISWKFVCEACGSNCTTTIPVINEAVNFATPPCPIPSSSLGDVFSQILPDESPTKGVKVTAVGSIKVEDSKGGSVINLAIDATIQ